MARLSGENKNISSGGRFPGKTVIGMTGGVGSGKSLILQLFRERYGACVLEADQVCKRLIEPDGSAFAAVVELLGERILDAEGRIDKAAMAALIFEDPAKRQAVNGILHPATFKAVLRLSEEARESLIVYESAIPREARFAELCDRILYVYAPRKMRAGRLAASRGYSAEKIRLIMKSQPTEKEYRALSDAVLPNTASPAETAEKLERLLKRWGIRGEK